MKWNQSLKCVSSLIAQWSISTCDARTYLQYCNKFLLALQIKIQPALQINEYVVSMDAMVGLLPIRKHKRKSVDEIHSDAIINNTACVENELCLEPYIWCRNLSQGPLDEPLRSHKPIIGGYHSIERYKHFSYKFRVSFSIEGMQVS